MARKDMAAFVNADLNVPIRHQSTDYDMIEDHISVRNISCDNKEYEEDEDKQETTKFSIHGAMEACDYLRRFYERCNDKCDISSLLCTINKDLIHRDFLKRCAKQFTIKGFLNVLNYDN